MQAWFGGAPRLSADASTNAPKCEERATLDVAARDPLSDHELCFEQSWASRIRAWSSAFGSAIGIHARNNRPQKRPGVLLGKRNLAFRAKGGVSSNL
jgi:hypothetical protein